MLPKASCIAEVRLERPGAIKGFVRINHLEAPQDVFDRFFSCSFAE
jgi:hypothetical protein